MFDLFNQLLKIDSASQILHSPSESLVQFFTHLFAREEFNSYLITSSLSHTKGIVELVIALTILFATFFWARLISGPDKPRERSKKNHFIRHIVRRLTWPILMLISAVLALYVWHNIFANTSIWLRLLVMGARWMILIRISLAIVNAALPNNRFTDRLEYSLSAVLWFTFILWVAGIDDIIIKWLKNMKFSIGSSKLNLYTILTGLIWVGIIMMLALWLARYIEVRLMSASRMDMNLRIVLAKITKIVLVFFSILIALPLVGIDLTILSVFGGALGVGIGFGLQKIASNYISGFIILGDRSIRPGDRLTVDGFTGYVTKITSRFVVLRSLGGQEALIPNETFVTSTVINESYTGKSLWQSLEIQVAYKSDLTLALSILEEAAARQERVGNDPAPSAFLVGFGDNGVNLTLGYWLTDPENGTFGINSAILMHIWQRFHEEGIEFPFPQREVRLLQDEAEADAPKAPSTAPTLAQSPTSRAHTRSTEPAGAEAQDE